MSIVAKIFEKAVGVRDAGTSAFLALALGTAPDAANRIGFYADTTGAAEQLVLVVGAQAGPAFLRSGSDVIATGMKVQDSTFQVVGSDTSKSLAFQVDTQGSGFQLTIDVGAQAANRTLSVPVLSGNRTLAVIDQAQTFTAAQTITKDLLVGSTSSNSYTGQFSGAGGTEIAGIGGGTYPRIQGFTAAFAAADIRIQPLGGSVILGGVAGAGLQITTTTGTTLTVSSTQASTNSVTGAQTIAGGLGVAGAINGGTTITATTRLVAVSAPSGSYGIETSTGIRGDRTSTDTNGVYAYDYRRIANTTASGTHHARAMSGSTYGTIASGQTNSGGWTGAWTEVLRNYVVSGDTGTLAQIMGLNINYGHFNTDASTPTTTAVKGISLNRYASSGSIGTMYGIHLENGSTTITPTTAYGIKIENTIGSTAYAIHTGTGIVSIGDTTDATSSTAAAVTMAGGLAVAKGQYIGTFLNVAGGASTTVATFGANARASDTFLDFNSAAGYRRTLRFASGGVGRWWIGVNQVPEGGANAGSNLIITALSDAGAEIGDVLAIVRASGGAILMYRPVTYSLPAATTSAITSAIGSTTAAAYHQITNTGANAIFGVERAAGGLIATGTSAYATVLGSVNATDLQLYSNGTVRLTMSNTGSVVVGTAALTTTATDGFLYVTTCPGTPTGVPTAQTGRSPIQIDSTNHKLYFYSGGAWRDAGP